jgi:hypothetical protein
MTSQTIKLNRLARSLSLCLINNSIYHDHEKVKRIIHNKSRNCLIKTAKQNSSNPAEKAMEMATEITLKLLEEINESQKFTFISTIHQIIQNLFNRLYSNLLKGEQQRLTSKSK